MPEVMLQTIPMDKWGKDHWSTFAYAACRVVANDGIPNREHMRCDADVHPGLTNSGNRLGGNQKYPTTLLDESKVKGHDDWSCIDDIEAAGLIESHGTGIHPVWALTDLGWEFNKVITKFKATKGATFQKFAERRDLWPKIEKGNE